MNTTVTTTTLTDFTFWYYMQGTQIGTLSLIADEQVLWEKSRRQGLPQWYSATVTLPVGNDIQVC